MGHTELNFIPRGVNQSCHKENAKRILVFFFLFLISSYTSMLLARLHLPPLALGLGNQNIICTMVHHSMAIHMFKIIINFLSETAWPIFTRFHVEASVEGV